MSQDYTTPGPTIGDVTEIRDNSQEDDTRAPRDGGIPTEGRENDTGQSTTEVPTTGNAATFDVNVQSDLTDEGSNFVPTGVAGRNYFIYYSNGEFSYKHQVKQSSPLLLTG